MANSITLAKNYTALLDEVYKNASVTSDLTSDPAMARAGTNANEILYPQISVSGLGDYSRSSGYTDGSVDVVWKSTTYNYDRGTKLTVDAMDDQETFNIAFGQAGATLQREKVAPEADAFTFAKLAGITGISKATPATYATADAFLTALLTAKTKMDEDEVPEENRYLYATPTLVNSLLALDSYKSKEVYESFANVKKVPQARFYTAINLLDGKTTGEEAGHYAKAAPVYTVTAAEPADWATKYKEYYTVSDGVYSNVTGETAPSWAAATYYKKTAEGGSDINFMIIHKPAIIKHDKHVVGNIIAPASNPNSDAYILKYRKYGIVDVYNNKVAGIYLSHKA